jgi:DNA-directed RNA polymerase alpha subunit
MIIDIDYVCLDLVKCSEAQLLSDAPNFGRKSLNEVKEVRKNTNGLELGMDVVWQKYLV